MRVIEVFNDTMNFIYAFLPQELLIIILAGLVMWIYLTYKKGEKNDHK
jgi:hypothetical protein